MLACGCPRRQGLGANALTVTAGCPLSTTDVSDPNNPKTVAVSAIDHDLCLARYYVEQTWETIGDWAKNTLVFLEDELSSLVKAIGNGWQGIKQWASDLAGRVKDFLTWLAKEVETVAFWLALGVLIFGGMFLVHELHPAINDSVHYYTRKSRT